jgi:predicted nucleic acid-binding protein
MVLVDSSVWVRFLGGREPYFSGMRTLLDRNEVVAHPLVYGELLMGDSARRDEFFALYERFPQAEVVSHSHVVEFVRVHRLTGRGVGWVDVHLLAAAIAARMQLWTADARLAEMAAERRVGYQPRS